MGDLVGASVDFVGEDVVGVKVGVPDGRGVGDAEGPGVGDVVGSIVGLGVGQVPLRFKEKEGKRKKRGKQIDIHCEPRERTKSSRIIAHRYVHKNLLPFNIARARAVQNELIHIGFRETDLGHILTVDHDVHGTVQSQASSVERVVLAPHTPPGVAFLGSNKVVDAVTV